MMTHEIVNFLIILEYNMRLLNIQDATKQKALIWLSYTDSSIYHY